MRRALYVLPMMAHPETGEKIPAIRLGVYLTSSTRRWADDEIVELQTPLGGYVITTGDDCWETVTVHHGQPFYTVIDEEDIDWDSYDGFVHINELRGVSRTLNQAAARGRHDPRHLHALLALSNAIENR